MMPKKFLYVNSNYEQTAIISSGTLSLTFGLSGTKLCLRLTACQSLSTGVLESPADIIAGCSYNCLLYWDSLTFGNNYFTILFQI